MGERLRLWADFSGHLTAFAQAHPRLEVRGDFGKSKVSTQGTTVARIGELVISPDQRLFAFRCDLDDIAADKHREKVADFLGQALVRASLARPRLDPTALETLLNLREQPARVEFICETSALSNGLVHYLAELLHDRCDLLVSPVSLREIQDLSSQGDSWKASAARVAHRLRECPPPGVLWRELPVEDVALLLSRGGVRRNNGNKASESDTSILRTARRAIHDQIRGLRRFFVVTDTDLARRATTELPPGSVVCGDSIHAIHDRVYLPAEWWPGAEGGQRITVASPERLIWELLGFLSAVELAAPDMTVRMSAFRPGQKKWPSDYVRPWVEFEETPVASSPDETTPPPSDRMGDATSTGRDTSLTDRLFPEREVERVSTIPQNFRIPVTTFFDQLARLSGGEALGDEDLDVVTNAEARRALASLLRGLGWHRSSPNSNRLKALRKAFATDDRELLTVLLEDWEPFRIMAREKDRSAVPDRAQRAIGRITNALGMSFEGRFGGANPRLQEVRDLLLSEAMRTRVIPMQTLILEIMHERLGVSPARTAQAWPRMSTSGVFDGFELREGGTPTQSGEDVVKLSTGRWAWTSVPVDALQGYRDLVWRSDV